MHFLKILKKLGPVLPCVLVAALAGGSLAGYKAPVPVGRAQIAEASNQLARKTKKKKTVQTNANITEAPVLTLVPVPTEEASSEDTSVSTGDIDLQKIPDGSYEGTGRGFEDGVTRARVTVQNHRIIAVNILSNQDSPEYFSQAESTVINEILSRQSADVDAVSGATMSSRGIREAVANALRKGMGQNVSDLQQNAASGTDGTSSSSAHVSINTGSTPSSLKDGTYIGTGRGFENGTTRVQVTVSGGKITSVQVLSNQDSPEYFARASVLTGRIVAQQSVNIDAVSGATMSSRGILEGAAAALRQAGASATAGENNQTTPAVTATPTPTKEAEENTSVEKGKFPYLDGVYLGTGDGNGGDIDVAVLIDDHTLKSVAILSAADEDEPFLTEAKTMLPKFISDQTEKVDAVTGATHTSDGINEAVADALKNAKKVTEEAEKNATPTVTPTSTVTPSSEATGTPAVTVTPSTEVTETPAPTVAPTETPTVEPTVSPTPTVSEGKYRDGTYTLSGQVEPDEDDDFDPYTLTFTMTVESGKITSIGNLSGDPDNENYYRRAANGTSSKQGVVSQIIEKQSADDIDTVSHATCSSNAIIEAVSEKLKEIAN